MGGIIVGIILGPPQGMAGVAFLVGCGIMGAIGLPVGLGVLALVGYGIYKCCKKSNPPVVNVSENTPSPRNANEQNAKLAVALEVKPTQQPSAPPPSPKKTVEITTLLGNKPNLFNQQPVLSNSNESSLADTTTLVTLHRTA